METNSYKNSKRSSKSGDKLKNRVITGKLLLWYKEDCRKLPWRKSTDPYPVWLSEIILQQTRVKQGLPYFLRFIKTFPRIRDLAGAREEEVLRLWQGLGYYSRARNLHRCARVICDSLNGQFPDTYKELLKLPGIGKYTAAAIASISFNECRAVVDGNVYRVLARLHGIKEDITVSKVQHIFQELANNMIPCNEPGNYNQAMMELGATICTPGKPECHRCPVRSSCTAYAEDIQAALPVKSRRNKARYRHFEYYVIQCGKKFLMQRRDKNDIWKGLYEFYLIEKAEGKNKYNVIPRTIKKLAETGRVMETSENYKSVLSHQHISARFRHIMVANTADLKALLKQDGTGLFSIREMESLPKPIMIDKYLNEVIF